MRAKIFGDFDKSVRVRAVFRTDNQHEVRFLRDAFYCNLSILGGVADVLRSRTFNVRELLLQGLNDIFCFVKAERCLSQVCNTI